MVRVMITGRDYCLGLMDLCEVYDAPIPLVIEVNHRDLTKLTEGFTEVQLTEAFQSAQWLGLGLGPASASGLGLEPSGNADIKTLFVSLLFCME